MSASPCPFVKFHVHDDNGNPASGWRLHAYEAGTDTPHALYKDASGLAEHPNPLTLDARGEPDGDGVYLEDGQAYKLVLRRPDGSTAWSQPYVLGSGSSGGGSSADVLLPARSLYGNASASTGEASAVPISDALADEANTVPSSHAVKAALDALSGDVLHDTGAQSLDGSLSVSGAVAVGSLTVGGQDIGSRFVRTDGHAVGSLVGCAQDGAGTAGDIPMVGSVDDATDGGSVPTVDAVRGMVDSMETGLVSTAYGDEPGYLAEKIRGGDTASVALDGGQLVVEVRPEILDALEAARGLSKVDADDSLDYLEQKIAAGAGVSVTKTADRKIEVANAAPETFRSQAHSASSLQGFLSSLLEAGTGINVALSPDMNRLVLTATGSAVGGFYWKGTWSVEGTYNVNNAVWYFDHTGDVPVSRLYIATTQNHGINPYDDAGIGTGTCWSCMMAVDYMGDQFVMLDAADTTAGFLADKLRAGSYVTLTRNADASGAWYTVDTLAPYQVNVGGVAKDYAALGGAIEFEATGGAVAWNGAKVLITSLALGETSSTAYRGDRGATAYSHSQATGNPHGTTFAQLVDKPNTLAGYGIAVDAVPTDGSSNAVSSNGVYDALVGKTGKNVGQTDWAQVSNGTGGWVWCYVGRVRIYDYADSVAAASWEVTLLTGGNVSASECYHVTIDGWCQCANGALTNSVRVAGDVKSDRVAFRFFSGDAGFANQELYVYMPPWSTLTCRLNYMYYAASHSVNMSIVSTPSGVTWLTTAPNTTIITGSATLPAGAPIGKNVFADNTGSTSNMTVSCNSGESIRVSYGSGMSGGGSSATVAAYYGKWFVKTSSKTWTLA